MTIVRNYKAHYILCSENKLEMNLVPSEMGLHPEQANAFRYRGFLLLEQPNKSWLVRPERSPMVMLPFRTHICSLQDVKVMLDIRLFEETKMNKAA